MKEIQICFNTMDEEFVNHLKEFFGDDIKISEVNGFDGLDYFAILVSVAALTFQIIDFFKTHKGKANEEENSNKHGSFLRTADGDIYFEDYSAEEICKILETLKNG